jgi:ribonuclease HI
MSILDYFKAEAAGISLDRPLVEQTRLQIYSDGACTANGRKAAQAAFGVAVFKNSKEVHTVAECLGPKELHTNQRAELKGLLKAMEIASMSEEGADIHTDSQYAMDCLQEWAPKWVAKGWRKADGEPVQNQDILKPMWGLWKNRGSKIRLFHIRSHTGRTDAHSRGNERADELATSCLHHDRQARQQFM